MQHGYPIQKYADSCKNHAAALPSCSAVSVFEIEIRIELERRAALIGRTAQRHSPL